jgi:peptidyl-prolyl cis-trans isomerase C
MHWTTTTGRNDTVTTNRKVTRRPQMRLAVLRLQLNPKSSPSKLRETEARLEEAREKAKRLLPGTVGFGPLAINYSDDDTTRYRGGDLGWLETDPSKYHFDEAMLKAGFGLKTAGEISPFIHGKEGLYLVRAIDRREAAATASNAGDELARHRATIGKSRAVENAFAEETRQMIPVTVNSAAMQKLAIHQPASAGDDVITGSPLSSPPIVNLSSAPQVCSN